MPDVSRLADRQMPLNLFKRRIVRSHKKNNSRVILQHLPILLAFSFKF